VKERVTQRQRKEERKKNRRKIIKTEVENRKIRRDIMCRNKENERMTEE
jgi:hypothetical protein